MIGVSIPDFFDRVRPAFCGIDALDDHLNLIHRLLHRSALADQVSGFPVPAVNGSTRYNQVADTGKTVEGFRMGTIAVPSRAISAIRG